MKVCTICGIKKKNTQFYLNGTYRRNACKECEGVKKSEWWNNSTPKERDVRYKANVAGQRSRVWRNTEWIASYLKSHPCVKCGESNIVVLEFHHRVPENKSYSICKLTGTGKSLELILTEVEKCDVLCANCHRIITAQERNYKILKFV